MNADDPLRTIHNIARKIEAEEQQALVNAPSVSESSFSDSPRGSLTVGSSGNLVVIDFGQPIRGGAIALPAEEANVLANAIARQARIVRIGQARKRHRSKRK